MISFTEEEEIITRVFNKNTQQEELSIPFRYYRVAEEKEAAAELVDENDAWHEIYEITRDGAVLIRPDGPIAWRSKAAINQAKRVLASQLLRYQ